MSNSAIIDLVSRFSAARIFEAKLMSRGWKSIFRQTGAPEAPFAWSIYPAEDVTQIVLPNPQNTSCSVKDCLESMAYRLDIRGYNEKRTDQRSPSDCTANNESAVLIKVLNCNLVPSQPIFAPTILVTFLKTPAITTSSAPNLNFRCLFVVFRGQYPTHDRFRPRVTLG